MSVTNRTNGSKQTKRQLSEKNVSKQTSNSSATRMSPLSTPLHRRLQTAAVLWHTTSIPIFATLFLMYLAVPVFWVFAFPYLVYLILNKTPTNGGVTSRYSEHLRGWRFWTYFCEYFPMKLYKTENLEPTFTKVEITDDYYTLPLLSFIKFKRPFYIKKVKTGPAYIFGLHPHGVVSLSGFGAFGTEGANWSKLFPGIPVCVLTISNQFKVPLYRDYLLALGITSVGRDNALSILRQGYSTAIVIGGAKESLTAQPGSTDLVLRKRKGFIKLALEAGEEICVVPCYAFGENEVYNVIHPGEGSFLRKIQLWLKNKLGFTLPFFHARGIFNYDFGLMPYRYPVNIVTGKPIKVPHIPNATEEQVDHYHKLYERELVSIFNNNKEKFNRHGDAQLNLLE